MVPCLEQGLLNEVVGALLVAAQRYAERAQATHFSHECISQARRHFRAQLFVSASLEIVQQSQEMLRYWLSGDFVEHRAHMAADVSLQVGGQPVGLGPVRLAWLAGGALLNCSVHFFVYAWHLLPAVLLVCLTVHSRSPVRLG
jgi:hypothetical protein